MIIGALAIAESDPQYAQQIIPAAVKSLPLALKSLRPRRRMGRRAGLLELRHALHGVWSGALQSALGKDFGLLQNRGPCPRRGISDLHGRPDGYYLNLPTWEKEAPEDRCLVCSGWPAHSTIRCTPSRARRDSSPRKRQPAARHVVRPAQPKVLESRDLDRYFRGPVEVAISRSAWNDPEPLGGVKAATTRSITAISTWATSSWTPSGVRWATRPRSDDYNKEGYWSKGRAASDGRTFV